MLGESFDFTSETNQSPSRPPKRARNASFSDGAAFGQMDDQETVGVPIPGTSAHRNMNTSANRNRQPDDRNGRKLSCKECRRLKLKCDRNFPCQSCVKRGCGTLCPDGALTSGRGSRFILAGAEQLHEKIFELCERVRQLEEAVEELQAVASSDPHPLLAPHLLKIKTSQELYGSAAFVAAASAQQQQCQSASVDSLRDENLRQSVGALTLGSQPVYAESSRPAADFMSRGASPPDVPSDILQLSMTFPFPWAVDVSMRGRIRDALPPKEEAQRICEEARAHALWQFNLDSSETFLPNLLHYCYTTPIEALSPRRLALLLMHLSIGSLVDLTKPLGSLNGEAYHHLARAAVCEIPLMEEPDFDVLHALFFMIWYHLIFSDNKKAVGYAWNLMGFVAKLAQGLGIHREKPRLKTIPEEHEKRRAVFWELLNMDCRMALSLGRPPSIRLAHVDIKPPTCVGPGLYVPREEILYHEWKNNFLIECLTPMLEAMVSIEQPEYSVIVRLDKAVRDFGVPALLDENQRQAIAPRFLVMQRGLVTMSREIALLQLHRRYFTDAMSSPETFDLTHPLAPSVLATYLGAASLIAAVEALFNQEQQLSVRFLHFWFNAFSAAVTLSLLISRAPSSPLAVHALRDLEKACRLFRAAGQVLPFTAKAMPVLQKLADRAQRLLYDNRNMNDITQTSSAEHELPQQPPASFVNVHSTILQSAGKMMSRVSASQNMPIGPPAELGTLTSTDEMREQAAEGPQETWLPDIYHFSSVGLSADDRYAVPTPRRTPFIPSSPRYSENEAFNFEHGALSMDLVEETSYMAWF